MADYELLLILKKEAVSDPKKAEAEIVALLEKTKAKVGKVDVWGVRKLAYPINKQTEGFYLIIDLKAKGEDLKNIRRAVELNKEVIRYLMTKKD